MGEQQQTIGGIAPVACWRDLVNGHDPYGIDTIMHKEAPEGWHFALNPVTGKIRLAPDEPNGTYGLPDPAMEKRDWHYAVDPRTGRVAWVPNVQMEITYRIADAEVPERGWHYALNPRTGKIEQSPNAASQLLEWKQRPWHLI